MNECIQIFSPYFIRFEDSPTQAIEQSTALLIKYEIFVALGY